MDVEAIVRPIRNAHSNRIFGNF